MERKFSSFEEIDTQLEILRIQRQMSLERLRLRFKGNPVRILKEGWLYSIRPALTDMAIGWALHKVREVRRVLRPENPTFDGPA